MNVCAALGCRRRGGARDERRQGVASAPSSCRTYSRCSAGRRARHGCARQGGLGHRAGAGARLGAAARRVGDGGFGRSGQWRDLHCAPANQVSSDFTPLDSGAERRGPARFARAVWSTIRWTRGKLRGCCRWMAPCVRGGSQRRAWQLVQGETELDLLLSDIGMPDMDGYELIAEMRRRRRHATLPAIAMTGYRRAQDEQRALAAGFNAHLKQADGCPSAEGAGALAGHRTPLRRCCGARRQRNRVSGCQAEASHSSALVRPAYSTGPARHGAIGFRSGTKGTCRTGSSFMQRP